MADEILKIGAEFDVSGIIEGTQKAGTALDDLSSVIARQAAVFQKSGLTEQEAKTQLEALGYTAQEVAIALGQEEAETDNVTSSTVRMGSAMGAARVEMGALTGSTGMMAGGLARIAATSSTLAPILTAAFPAFALIAFIDLISAAIDKFEKWKELGAETVHGIDDLTLSIIRQADSLDLENIKLDNTIAKLENKPVDHLSPALLEIKIKAEELGKAIEDDIVKTEKLLSAGPGIFSELLLGKGDQSAVGKQIQPLERAYQLALLGNDATEQRNVLLQEQQILEKAITDEKAHHSEMIVTETGMVKVGRDADQDALNAYSESLKGIAAQLHELDTLADISAKTPKVAKLETAKDAEEAAKKKRDAAYEDFALLNEQQELAAKGVADDLKNVDAIMDIHRQENEFFAKTMQKDVDEEIKSSQKKVDAEVKYHEQVDKLAETAALKQISTEEAVYSSHQGITLAAQINDISNLERLNDEKLTIQKKALEEQKAILLGGETEQTFAGTASPQQLAQLETINRQIEETQSAHDTKMIELAKKAAAEIKKQGDEQTAAYMKIFNPINRAMDGMVNGILQGTETIGRAFSRMGGNILLTTIDAVAQMSLKWAEHFIIVEVLEKVSVLKRIADFVSGESIKHAAQAAATAAEANTAAGIAAAWAFESVMASLPFPINVATAPEVAATTYAEVLAFGIPKAEQGAEISHDSLLYAHAGEIVAPKPLSAEMHSLAPNIQRFNSTMEAAPAAASGAPSNTMNSTSNFNISALDPASFMDYAHRNQRQFVSLARGMARNGVKAR